MEERRGAPGVIAVDDPRADDVRALLEQHLAFADSESPPEDVHALDVAALTGPGITFVSCRESGRLLGVGALQSLDGRHGELKSMHTAATARGRGVGAAVLAHLVGLARDRGFERLSLETGTTDGFAPARRLYARHGFVACGPFAGYGPSSYSTFLTLDLTARPAVVVAR